MLAAYARLPAPNLSDHPTPPGQVIVPADLPPSPADPDLFPGYRIYLPPRLGRVPAVLTAGVHASVPLHLEVPLQLDDVQRTGWGPNDTLRWRWLHPAVPHARSVRLPAGLAWQARLSPLVRLPVTAGEHQLQIQVGRFDGHVPLTVIDATSSQAWPTLGATKSGLVRLSTDLASGETTSHPALVVLPKPPNADNRQWPALPLATATARMWGDPLAGGAAPGLWPASPPSDPAHVAAVIGDAYQHPQQLAAETIQRLSTWRRAADVPAQLVLSPGWAGLRTGQSANELSTVLWAVRQRAQRLGVRMRLALLLPPLPAAMHLQTRATQARIIWRRAALHLGWDVLDLDGIAHTLQPNGLHAPGPVNAGACRALVQRWLADDAPLPELTVTELPRLVYVDEQRFIAVAAHGPWLPE